ncbi:class I SAM-dependent methyltransferase [Amycolatopsis taiwanensis]|uniref:Methyltransferase n=1 Tax=Amycolatopsis taiwanensis TaxID=342230 RepID=A0A9W6VFX5_9PSEU|nr:methyltransferase domain-containing protein [Amycolatopsis taiwanensis]GLY67220.1 methyltransferase [Amycolatopsis taiwanensis]
MTTPFDRLLERITAFVRAPTNAAIDRHVLAAAGIRPGEAVLVIGDRPELGQHTASAEHTGQDDESVDVVLSVNDVQSWTDRAAGFAELRRVLKPGGRLVLSAPEDRLPVPRHELAAEAAAAGFTDLQTWVWAPPGPAAPLAAQLRALRP